MFEKEENNTYRDAAVGDVERRERPYLDEICHATIDDTINDIRRRPSENQTETHGPSAWMDSADRHEQNKDKCSRNQQKLK